MSYCKDCIFCEGKNSEFVYCKNFEKSMKSLDSCSKHISISLIQRSGNISIQK